jgi:DNA/RNA-binding domain of Phe-tRNA-synthetase-like protein
MVSVTIDGAVKDLQIGVVFGQGLTIGPGNSDLRRAIEQRVSQVVERGPSGGDPRREAVRGMLRAGGFKPAGRNKPAQEYLLRTVRESGALPFIFNAVDWLNAVSLASGIPISLLAAERLGERAVARYGRQGERFVFNRAGQELDLAGLICVCAVQGSDSAPLGTPIKDSMAGKISENDRNVVAILYAPQQAVSEDELSGWCAELGEGFRRFCAAERYDARIERSSA